MQLYYDLTAVHVMFDMLDKPNIAGDVYNITLENDLASAVQLYNDAMSSGNLQLSVVVGTDVKVRMTMMMICFIKHEIVSLETTLSAYSRARARTHTHTHTRTHARTHAPRTHAHARARARTHTHTHTDTHTHTHTYIHTNTHTHTHTHTHKYTHTRARAHTHTHTHTHIHTHTRAHAQLRFGRYLQ